jgi:hypothetical protein
METEIYDTNKKIVKDIDECYNPIGDIPNTYENLPKCLIKFIDIGTTIKVEKNGKIYIGGKLYCVYDNNIILKHYNEYIYVNIDEYNIYIYNPDLNKNKKIKKPIKKYIRVLNIN